MTGTGLLEFKVTRPLWLEVLPNQAAGSGPLLVAPRVDGRDVAVWAQVLFNCRAETFFKMPSNLRALILVCLIKFPSKPGRVLAGKC